MIQGKLYRKDGSLLRRVKYQMLGVWLYTYLRLMKNQHKLIMQMREQMKTARSLERLKVASLIENGIDHLPNSCQGMCDSHLIVEFIKALEDKSDGE
ncbi:hypothetical protein UFOVP115_69 [uncultured Caudovirales phage]|uniref:Uncharacterized protein n=1 Tax=uncultured Caudovirales phage TaxID=2100421 RepID=A0A6J5L8H7_9CAUD|nr:hypothetical protein UFOVP115_69 [uncultured Caudovirales phage]